MRKKTRGDYHGMSEQERTITLPDIKRGATVYIVRTDEVLPVTYNGVSHGVVDGDGKFHVACEVKTKKRREMSYTYRKVEKTVVFEKGHTFLFYAGNIGKTVFLTRPEAQKAIQCVCRGCYTDGRCEFQDDGRNPRWYKPTEPETNGCDWRTTPEEREAFFKRGAGA